MTEDSLEGFADNLCRLMPIFAREFIRGETNEFFHDQITPPQFLALDFIFRNGESKMKDLASFMKVSTAATTGIVDRLVKAGYVKRLFDADDRRIIKLGLTPKGGELVRRINEQRRKMTMRVFAKVSQRDRADYLRIITQIRDALAKEELALKVSS
ncbi:MAG: MarR family transcriptional regulator [Candidatus Omnitrophota bacterium]